MTAIEEKKCDEWLRSHVKHWQTYRRGNWKYRWKGKTLVRYLDNVSMRELQDGLVLEYLCSSACMKTLSLYSQDVPKDWTPVNAWYESMPMRPSNTGMAQVRLYHALKIDVENGGDGPYVAEDGCMWKVSWTFFWKQSEVAELPKSESGINYTIRNLNRDDEDGTFSYMLECRERVQQDIEEYLRETDVFSSKYHEEHIGVKGDPSEGGKQASCVPGEKVVRTVRKNEDCTHDVINDRVTEEGVPEATTESHATIRGITKTTVNRSMPEKADETNLAIGDTVRNEKTETGLWNQTIVHKEGGFEGWMRKSCSEILSRHEDSETDIVGEDPGFTHVSGPGEHPGTTFEKSVTRNDDNTFDVQTTTRNDLPVEEAEVSVRKTLDGVVRTVTNRNQPAPLPTENLPIGGRVVNRRTESDLYDVTSEYVAIEDVGKVNEDCLKNAHEHRHTVAEVVSQNPGPVDAHEVYGGVVYETAVQRTDNGAYRKTDVTRAAVLAEATAEGGSVDRTVTSTSKINSPEENLGAPEPETNMEVDVSSSRNEFGLFNGNVRVVRHNEVQSVAKYGSPLATETTTVSEFTGEQPDDTPRKGVIYSSSASPNNVGSHRTSVTVREAHKKMLPSREKDEGDFSEVRWTDVRETRNTRIFYANRIVIFRNFANAPAIVKEDENEGVSVHVSINEFGLLDGTYQFTRYIGEEEVTRGSGSGPGEQGDETKIVPSRRIAKYVWRDPDDGERYLVTKTYRQYFKVRYLWSSRVHMLKEVLQGENYPQYGMYSGMHGWYCKIVTSESAETLVDTKKELAAPTS